MNDVVTDEKHMKIHITSGDRTFGGESVWAIDLGDNKARINNLPFFTEKCGFEDIVEYEDRDGICEFVKVIHKVNDSWGITWTPTDDMSDEWKQICEYLRANDIRFESAMAGMFVVAISSCLTEDEAFSRLKAICYASPIKLIPYSGDAGDGDDEDFDC